MPCDCKKTENIKKGKYKNVQLYQCKNCKKKFRETYSIERMDEGKKKKLVGFHCEGMGTRSIAREMGISHTCVMKTKLKIAAALPEPELVSGQVYQVDELVTFVAWKKKPKPKPGKRYSESRLPITIRILCIISHTGS